MNISHLKREMYKARIAELSGALELALALLGKFEPGDSRAVSDHFVAMAAILAGGTIVNEESRQIVKNMLEKVKHDDKIKDDIELCAGPITSQDGDYLTYRWIHPDTRWWEVRVRCDEPLPRHPLYEQMHFKPVTSNILIQIL